MKTYHFATDQFGISDEGIHLLRNRYNFETHPFPTIDEILIRRGRQINNWLVILIIGIALAAGALVYGFFLLNEFFFGHSVNRFYVEQFALPVIPLFLGVLMVYNSLKSGLTIQLRIRNKTKSFSIESMSKSGELTDFLQLLKANEATGSKLKIKSEHLPKQIPAMQ